ncbi:hypothetical protein [Streptomyces canus]|uniref:hypothetical protein n=1 Tax=Streptomyces canus TaxID=58343 RepID=UPI00380AA3FB
MGGKPARRRRPGLIVSGAVAAAALLIPGGVLGVLGVLAILAVVLPPVLGPTPVEGIEITRPLWMFWWFFPMEEWFGVASIDYVIAGVFGLIFLVPFLDRSPHRLWSKRTITMSVATVLLLSLIAVTVEVWVNNPKGH